MAIHNNPRLFARTLDTVNQPTVPRGGVQNLCDPCAPPPTCACGQLECLCRPRFFAGQLLTEQDLNRLDGYIRGKNRLHNKQLFGTGVVGGLEVRCDPCGGGVTVTPGYALSPCGEDIVVCEEQQVDVCSLISRCRPPDPCAPYGGTKGKEGKGCEETVEDWVLTIAYDESPARSVAALRMGTGCSCGGGGSSSKASGGCSCGGASSATAARSSGGCSCGGSGSASAKASGGGRSCSCGGTTTTTTPRGAPTACEPTITCEGFRFDAYPAPVEDNEKVGILGGAIWQRFLCCAEPLFKSLPKAPSEPPSESNAESWVLWCKRSKAALVAFLTDRPALGCTLLQQAQRLTCSAAGGTTYDHRAVSEGLLALLLLLVDVVLSCFCSALLPPPAAPSVDERVPLAVVRVRRKECKVVDVCNWTPLRNQVLTFPTLQYWLSLLPIGAALQSLVHAVCCRGPLERRYLQEERLKTEAPIHAQMQMERPAASAPLKEEAAPAGAEAGGGAQGTGWTTGTVKPGLADPIALRLNPQLSPEMQRKGEAAVGLFGAAASRGFAPLDPQELMGSLLGWKVGEGKGLTAAERDNLPQMLALHQLVAPLVAGVFPEGLPKLAEVMLAVSPAARQAAAPAAAPQAAGNEVEALKARLASLEETVAALRAGKGQG